MVWHIYRFSRCHFDRFWSLLMYSQSYIFILEITIIPMPFLFLIISKRFHFQWKNKSESDGTFYRLFGPFSSLLLCIFLFRMNITLGDMCVMDVIYLFVIYMTIVLKDIHDFVFILKRVTYTMESVYLIFSKPSAK